jgi:hypothetical protein
VIAPDDPGSESARLVVNAAIDRRPALIIRPVDCADVSLAVSAARAHGTELAIRGSGHSFAGHGTSDGGFVLDMSNMRGLHIDPQSRTAWAQAGLTTGEYTTETARHGLTTGFGDTGSVGIVGLTLGGGIGWLVRKHGLTVDDLLAVEVVTADGERLHVDSERHPDLFWALRGGGGNFAVVTRLHYRLHRLDTILGGLLVLPATPAILGSFIAAAHDAPDELSTIAILTGLPPLPFVPSEYHGRLALMVRLAYAGDPERGEHALASLRALATPLADAITPMPYRQMYAEDGPGAQRVRMAIRSMFLNLPDEHAVATIFERMEAQPSPTAAVQIRVLGGAMARVPADSTAFAHRERRMMLTFAAGYQDLNQAESHETWVADSLAAMRPPRTASTSASSARRAPLESTRHIPTRPTGGSRRSNDATTRPISSGSTRTSSRMAGRGDERPAMTGARSRRRRARGRFQGPARSRRGVRPRLRCHIRGGFRV